MTTIAITMYLLHGTVTYCGVPVVDAPPWVAMPVETYGIDWQCGDKIGIWADSEIRVFQALDAGPFGRYCVMQPDGECLPIAADVPEPWAWFDGLSTTGRVWNVTEIQRIWTERGRE